MTGRAQNPSLNEAVALPVDGLQLAQENGILRAIIAELLAKNQNLRWALLGKADQLVAG